MATTKTEQFRLGPCVVEPGRDRIYRGDASVAVHPREMDLLVFLAGKDGEVASIGEIVDTVWKGTIVTDQSVYYAIHQLREALDEPNAELSLIETVPRRGYRLTETLEPIDRSGGEATPPVTGPEQRSVSVRASAGGLMLLWVLGIGIPPAEVSIAVLSFDDLGIEPDNQYLTEAVPSDLTTQLSRICDSRIASRTSARAVEDAGYDVPALAGRLNVRYVLEGGVQQSENHFRISARLIEAATDKLVWADEFRRELSTPDLFWVQENIVREIARKLEASFCPEPPSPAPRMPTANREAYRLLQLGKQRFDRRITPAVIESVSYFRRAIELDPNYAEAYARLARAYQFWARMRSDWPPGISEDDIRELLERALELDEGLAIAHAEMALALEDVDRDRSVAEFERALELEPGNVEIYDAAIVLADHGWNRVYLQNHDRELELYLQALDIDPLAPNILRLTAFHYRVLGQRDLAADYYRRAIESEAQFVFGYHLLGHMAWGDGRLDDAVRLFRRAHAMDPAFWEPVWLTGLVYLGLGDDVEAERWLERAGQMHGTIAWGLPAVFDRRGDHRREFEIYDEVVVHSPAFMWGIRVTHFLADGRLGEAEALFRQHDPDAFDSDVDWLQLLPGEAGRRNTAAILLHRSGKTAEAQRIWSGLETWYENNRDWLVRSEFSRTGGAVIYASQGKTERAIEELQTAVNNGWRAQWEIRIEDPRFDPIREDPRFVTIGEFIRADKARQLTNVRVMEASGEIPPMQPLPELPGP